MLFHGWLEKPASEVPLDLALRVRLDDAPTSTDFAVGNPFSATVVDPGEYQRARVYGHVAAVDISGEPRLKGIDMKARIRIGQDGQNNHG